MPPHTYDDHQMYNIIMVSTDLSKLSELSKTKSESIRIKTRFRTKFLNFRSIDLWNFLEPCENRNAHKRFILDARRSHGNAALCISVLYYCVDGYCVGT